MTERYVVQARGWPSTETPIDVWQDVAKTTDPDTAQRMAEAFGSHPATVEVRVVEVKRD
jgi:Mg2+ and Co2+ transporter CorA